MVVSLKRPQHLYCDFDSGCSLFFEQMSYNLELISFKFYRYGTPPESCLVTVFSLTTSLV